MAGKFHFALVSPEREVFHGEVDHVVVPGAEGEFGVLAGHAPVMSTLLPGALKIINDGVITRIFVNGGFADVTPEGLTVLAEDAVDLGAIDAAQIEADLKNAQDDARDASSEAKREAAAARVARLEHLKAALAA